MNFPQKQVSSPSYYPPPPLEGEEIKRRGRRISFLLYLWYYSIINLKLILHLKNYG